MASFEPGPELDALVAEKVMGWDPCPRPFKAPENGNTIWRLGKGEEEEWGVLIHRGNGFSFWDEWSPSTSIADAWEVVEQWSDVLVNRSGNPLRDGWEAPWHACVDDCHGHGYTAPHAICLAALRAKGVEL